MPPANEQKGNADTQSTRNAQETSTRNDRREDIPAVLPPVQTILERTIVRDQLKYADQTQMKDSDKTSIQPSVVMPNRPQPLHPNEQTSQAAVDSAPVSAPDEKAGAIQQQKHHQLNPTAGEPAVVTAEKALSESYRSGSRLLRPVPVSGQTGTRKEKEKESPTLRIGKMIVEVVMEQKKPMPLRKNSSPSSQNNITARRNPLTYGLGQM